MIHALESEYQDRPTHVRVLQPSTLAKDRRYPVVYVLPVEAGDESRYGDGLAEVKNLGLHDKLGLIFAAPTFARLPWYADHPSAKGIRQETHFRRVVVPFIESKYPALAKPEGRLLLGFSKSGWGAFTLLLRHPETFGKAAAWDAPLDMDRPGKYGSGDIFGDDATFQKYRVTALLEGSKLGEKARLAVLGHGNFRPAHAAVHDLMTRLRIPHEYQDGPARKHDWHSGWVAGAVTWLAGR